MHQGNAHTSASLSMRWLAWLLAFVLVVAFLTGGGSQDRGPGDLVAQLSALPLLVHALLTLSTQPLSGLRRMALCTGLVVMAIPLLQMLPLPAALWQSNPSRMALAHDLSVAGVALPGTWSLAPDATRRAALSLLPAISIFLGALAIDGRYRVRMLWLYLGLALFSMLLGVVQLGLPQDSLLNPFPQWAPAFGGVFANPNHQATALASAAVVALSLVLTHGHGDSRNGRQLATTWVMGLYCGLCVLALPLTGSRGGALIGVLALVSTPVVMGAFTLSRLRHSRRRRFGLAILICGAAVGAWVSLRWIEVDVVSEMRWSLARATAALGNAYAPFGTGMGSFVAVFEQEGPASMLGPAYINHAHNEYVQWWLEAGVLGMLALVGVVAVLGVALGDLLRSPAQSRGRGVAAGAWLGCMVMMMHSMVDYPMRTVALMAVAGLLAGIAVAQSDELKRKHAIGE